MSDPNRQENGETEVPLWVALITYLLCWGLGGYLLVAEQRSGQPNNGLLIVGVLFVLFPVLSFQGLGKALARAIARRIGGPQ